MSKPNPQKNKMDDRKSITAAQSRQLLQVQKDILEIAINGNNYQASLDALCLAAEGIVENSIACIMLFNEQENSLTMRAAPNLCQAAIERMNQLKPGEHTGSCGTAVYRASPQFVDNTATDKRWHELIDFANTFNIHACWSVPIMSNSNKVMGTFAILGFEKGAPCIFQQNLLQTASYLAALLLNRETADLAIKTLAHSDPLTKLANRTFFESQAQKLISQAKENKEQLALLFIDLDDFKAINDQFGHTEGDKVLRCIAARIANNTRQNDVIARLGGDEFVMIIDEVSHIDEVKTIAFNMLNNLRLPISIEGRLHNVSGSIGISQFPKDADDIDGLLAHADNAMYQAKKIGKNQFYFN